MTKRTRNKLGQFTSFTLMDPKPEIFFVKATQMIFKLFMVIFLLFMVNLVDSSFEVKENTKASILNN